jgi:hypothetical protein
MRLLPDPNADERCLWLDRYLTVCANDALRSQDGQPPLSCAIQPIGDRHRLWMTIMSASRVSFSSILLASVLISAAASAQGNGRWTSGTPTPSERTEVAAGEVSGRIYVLGGFRGELELEIYDPASDRWSRGAVIPRPVHHAAVDIHWLKGRLYSRRELSEAQKRQSDTPEEDR